MLAYRCGCTIDNGDTKFCNEHAARALKLDNMMDGAALMDEIYRGPRARECTLCHRREPEVAFGWGQPWCDYCQEEVKRRRTPLEVSLAEDVRASERCD